MAFANIISVTETEFNPAATAHLVDMPATVLVNELLIVILCVNGSATTAEPSAWTEKSDDQDGTGNVSVSITVKKAIGDEDGTTVDFVTSVSRKAAAQCFRIENWSGDINDVEVGSFIDGVSNTSDPPSLTLATGLDDNLWIALGTMNGNQSVTSGPSGYSTPIVNAATGVSSATLATAENDVAAATENPGTFLWDDSDEWIGQTIGIPPAGGAPPAGLIIPRQQLTTVRL